MSKKEIKKIFKTKTKLILFALISLVIGTLLLVHGSTIEYDEKAKDLRSYKYLLDNGQDKEKTYVFLNIVYAKQFAVNESQNLDYYYVQDSEGYTYIAAISKKTFNKIKEEADKNSNILNYQLEGYLYNVEDDVKQLAQEYYEETFEVKLDSSNYLDYLSNTYLNENVKYYSKDADIWIYFGLFMWLVSAILIIYYIIDTICYKIKIKKYNVKLLKEEMEKGSTKYYKSDNICLTDHYIISKVNGVRVISYNNILWAYYKTIKIYGITLKNNIIVCTDNFKFYKVATNGNYLEGLIDILNEIKNKNENILIGYSEENKNKIKEMRENGK